MKPEDTKEGVYYAIDNSLKSVFICSGHVSGSIPSEIYMHRTDRKYNKRGNPFYFYLNILRPATPQEIAHLDACIAADKYVDEPKSLNIADVKIGEIIWYGNDLLEFQGIDVVCFNVSRIVGIRNETWNFNATNFPHNKLSYATTEEIQWYHACKKANSYLNKEDFLKSGTEFLKGQYIVLQDPCLNEDTYKNHWCYKQRESASCFNSELDSKGSETNGWGRFEKRDTHNWRYATPKEIAEYERLGNPYDVTTLNQEEFTFRHTGKLNNAVYCDNKEEYECLKAFLHSMGVKLEASLYNKDTMSAIGEHAFDKTDRGSWRACTKDRFVNDTSNFKTYSFKEYQAKLATIGISLFLPAAPNLLTQTTQFQAGDLVECIEDYGTASLIKGKVYEVSNVKGDYICVKGEPYEWINTRFKLVSSVPGSMKFKNPYDYLLIPDGVWPSKAPGTNTEITKQPYKSVSTSLLELLKPKPKPQKERVKFVLRDIHELKK